MWDATASGHIQNILNFTRISYDWYLDELNKEYGKIDEDCICENLRKKLVSAVRLGKNFIINVDKLCPDFMLHEDFDYNMIFDYE